MIVGQEARGERAASPKPGRMRRWASSGMSMIYPTSGVKPNPREPMWNWSPRNRSTPSKRVVGERGILRCQRSIKTGVRHMVTRNGHLCHYTTAEGLISMITKREIWATDIFYLNDKSELVYGIDLATDELKCGRVPDAYRSGVSEAIDRLSGLKELRPHLTAHRVYVCSFSGKLDDLSQWRSYCPQGGYAVEFSPEMLIATAHRQGFDLFACVYKEEAQRRLSR
jgi:hypothetical protein